MALDAAVGRTEGLTIPTRVKRRVVTLDWLLPFACGKFNRPQTGPPHEHGLTLSIEADYGADGLVSRSFGHAASFVVALGTSP